MNALDSDTWQVESRTKGTWSELKGNCAGEVLRQRTSSALSSPESAQKSAQTAPPLPIRLVWYRRKAAKSGTKNTPDRYRFGSCGTRVTRMFAVIGLFSSNTATGNQRYRAYTETDVTMASRTETRNSKEIATVTGSLTSPRESSTLPGCANRARPDLWEPWGGNDPGPPSAPSLANNFHNHERALDGWCLLIDAPTSRAATSSSSQILLQSRPASHAVIYHPRAHFQDGSAAEQQSLGFLG